MELNAMLAHPAALPSLPRAVALLMTELVHDEPACVGPTSSWQRSGPDRPSRSICGAPLDNNAYEPLAGGIHLA